ncbi:hypothetical protein ACIRPT_27505 [Streptomyces sp. NPDC101227]|uniref:hypothetical protein n=1 Tax=Streptomyces sp. NPDC101227 TaxID=3366136 RepID=UPI003819E9B3
MSEITGTKGKIAPGQYKDFSVAFGALPDDTDHLVFKAPVGYQVGHPVHQRLDRARHRRRRSRRRGPGSDHGRCRDRPQPHPLPLTAHRRACITLLVNKVGNWGTGPPD